MYETGYIKSQILIKLSERKNDRVSNTMAFIWYANATRSAREINTYMVSIGKEEIFAIGDSVQNTDYEAMVSKYEYLMSEPDVDTSNTDASV